MHSRGKKVRTVDESIRIGAELLTFKQPRLKSVRNVLMAHSMTSGPWLSKIKFNETRDFFTCIASKYPELYGLRKNYKKNWE